MIRTAFFTQWPPPSLLHLFIPFVLHIVWTPWQYIYNLGNAVSTGPSNRAPILYWPSNYSEILIMSELEGITQLSQCLLSKCSDGKTNLEESCNSNPSLLTPKFEFNYITFLPIPKLYSSRSRSPTPTSLLLSSSKNSHPEMLPFSHGPLPLVSRIPVPR